MNKFFPVIIAVVIGIIGASAYFVIFFDDFNIVDNQPSGFSTAISSGPITILQYEHRLAENVFIHIRGVGPDEKGNIRFFTPEGVLYKTISYDGSVKQDFNQYFKPEPSILLQICTPEEIIGEWTITFDNNVYPPLKFKVLETPLRGAEQEIKKIC